MEDSALAIIPARSESKGLPGKNVMLLGGYPLLAYTIIAAQSSSCINRVIVSTDSEEYANIAKRVGAEVPFLRPKEYAGDQSSDLGFMRHAMQWVKDQDDVVPEFWVHLRPTTPLRDPAVIDRAIGWFIKNPKATALRSGHLATESRFKWFLRDCDGYFCPVKNDLTAADVNEPRQGFPDAYIPDGYVDVVRASHVLHNETLHGEHMLVFESPVCTEIDTMEDFDYLEYQLQRVGFPLLDQLKQSVARDGQSFFPTPTA